MNDIKERGRLVRMGDRNIRGALSSSWNDQREAEAWGG